MNVTVGYQQRIISSPVNSMVFSSSTDCNYSTCHVTDDSSIHRFTYDAGSGTWTHDAFPFTWLLDIALSPDESTLLAVTETQLLQLDPVTMNPTAPAVDLPALQPGTLKDSSGCT